MPRQLRPGDFVGGEYRILKVFGGEGQSGMGVVYLVENRSFYEPFVLKTYQSSELGDMKPRFLKEANAWVNLGSHPNIVRCLWVNDIDDVLYVAAAYIAPDDDGLNTLEARLELGTVPLDKQLRWSAQVCFAMRYARSKGVVSHRDLKPANMMLDRGTLKVTDFGLAKLQGQVDQAVALMKRTDAAITMCGTAIGTPPFMAPEQFVDATGVDQRADIYSFGVILFLMATGELPIYPSRRATDQHEILLLWALAHHHSSVRRADFPLFPIVHRCLEKDAAKRFQSFDELLAALARAAKANKVALPKEQVIDSAFDDAYALAMSLTALGKPDEAIAKLTEITRKWPSAPSPFNEMGKLLRSKGKVAKAVPWFKRAIELDESRSAPWNNLGGAHAQLSEFEEAERAYATAIRVDSENTGAMIGLAQLLADKNPALAWKWCERAHQLRPKKLIVLRIAGEVALMTGRPDDAVQLLSDAVKQQPSDQRTSFNLALAYRARKMLNEHADALEQYLARWPKDRRAYQLLSQAYVDLRDLDTATDVCLRWSKLAGAEVSGTINLAHLLAAQGKNLQGYVFANKALEKFPRHAGLWLCIAHVLKDVPQYRQQARTAAENAMSCVHEPVTQPPRVTAADVQAVLRG